MTGWSTEDWLGGTTGDWTIVSSGANPTCSPHGGASMAMFNSYTADAGDGTLLYRTSGINIPVSYSPVRLNFWMYHDSNNPGNQDVIAPQICTDGMTSCSGNLAIINRYSATPGWSQHTVDLSAYMGSSNVQIFFLGFSAHGGNMYIDDVGVTVADVTYNLMRDSTTVVTDYTSGATYVPGSGIFEYTVQAVNSCARTGSEGVSFADANGTPDAPTINSITDVDPCALSGIQINYTGVSTPQATAC